MYLDDLVIFSSTFDEAVNRLDTVFQRLASAGLKLNPKKCNLFRKEVAYLGHVVSEDGVSTDPEKISAITQWPRPKNLTEVRSFLGTCSYYRRFIRNFSQIAKPLHLLTEKNRPFDWTPNCDDAFHLLKSALTSSPILAYPNEIDGFILDCDACNTGVGAVLSQVQDGQERVIAYFSKSLGKAERHYCVTRKELLAIVLAVKHFHHYLLGKLFKVRTDHGALRWLMNFKNPEGQVARWIEVLSTYQFEIEHRPGVKHGNADGLSRRPCNEIECKQCNKMLEGSKEKSVHVPKRLRNKEKLL